MAWGESRAGVCWDTKRFLGPVYLGIGDGGITIVTEGEIYVVRAPASRLVGGRRHGRVVSKCWCWC